MKTYKVFLYWVLTLLIGSILFSILDTIVYSKGSNFLESIEVVFGSTIMGLYYAVFSSMLPLVCLLVLNFYYKKTKKLNIREVFIIKLSIVVTTFCTMFVLDNYNNLEFYLYSFFCYGFTGFFFWWREFKRIESKSS